MTSTPTTPSLFLFRRLLLLRLVVAVAVAFLTVAPAAIAMSSSKPQHEQEPGDASNFFSKLEARVKAVGSHLCVGLDPHASELRLGDGTTEEEACDAAFTFCKTIIDETAPYAAAFKPNAAFFEALGPNLGAATLRRVVSSIPDGIPVLLDVKRGDIGSTAGAYADACYEREGGLAADGVTLSPLMGWDSVKPFITGKYADRGAFVLCKTSNPGSNELLALELSDGATVFETIAGLADSWSRRAAEEDGGTAASSSSSTPPPPRLGLVVGATDPSALSKARSAAGPSAWILAPGVGAQGGDLEDACRAGLNEEGTGLLVPVSRGISRADDRAAEAKKIRDAINAAREAVAPSGGMEGSACDADGGGGGGGGSSGGVAPYQREFLEFSLAEGVLKFGSFVLKSGRTSPYFFNAGLFSTGGALHKLGKAYAAAIMASKDLTENGKPAFDVIFGPAYKGISLGALVCASLFSNYGVDVGFAYNRKEAKDHGEGGMLVGASMDGKRVLVVDDVITAGTAIRESHAMLARIGATPLGVAIALDRAEKRSLDDPVSAVQAVARDLSLPVVSIVSLPQLQAFLEKNSSYGDDVLASVKQYRAQYGV